MIFSRLWLVPLVLGFTARFQTPYPFSNVALAAFDGWDQDHNGALSSGEIDRSLLDPHNKGDQACALAALHMWLLVGLDTAPRLTKSFFTTFVPKPKPTFPAGPPDVVEAAKDAWHRRPDTLFNRFQIARQFLAGNQSLSLFASTGPSLLDIKQGALGNCYMLAPLGALVYRNVDDVRRMVKDEEGTYLVTFPGARRVHVSPPTDGELAMAGADTKGGEWIRIVEKAYGTLKIQDSEADSKVVREGVMGGIGADAARIFTGHEFRNFELIGDWRRPVSREQLNLLHRELVLALSQRALVIAGTPLSIAPTGIFPRHAYAVLGFDAIQDRITLWNPHGNDSVPAGPDGFRNGYLTKGGVFTMPLDQFARAFSGILFEQLDQR